MDFTLQICVTHKLDFLWPFRVFVQERLEEDRRTKDKEKEGTSLSIFIFKEKGFCPLSLILGRGSFIRYFGCSQWEREEGRRNFWKKDLPRSGYGYSFLTMYPSDSFYTHLSGTTQRGESDNRNLVWTNGLM